MIAANDTVPIVPWIQIGPRVKHGTYAKTYTKTGKRKLPFFLAGFSAQSSILNGPMALIRYMDEQFPF